VAPKVTVSLARPLVEYLLRGIFSRGRIKQRCVRISTLSAALATRPRQNSGLHRPSAWHSLGPYRGNEICPTLSPELQRCFGDGYCRDPPESSADA